MTDSYNNHKEKHEQAIGQYILWVSSEWVQFSTSQFLVLERSSCCTVAFIYNGTLKGKQFFI